MNESECIPFEQSCSSFLTTELELFLEFLENFWNFKTFSRALEKVLKFCIKYINFQGISLNQSKIWPSLRHIVENLQIVFNIFERKL